MCGSFAGVTMTMMASRMTMYVFDILISSPSFGNVLLKFVTKIVHTTTQASPAPDLSCTVPGCYTHGRPFSYVWKYPCTVTPTVTTTSQPSLTCFFLCQSFFVTCLGVREINESTCSCAIQKRGRSSLAVLYGAAFTTSPIVLSAASSAMFQRFTLALKCRRSASRLQKKSDCIE